MVYLSLPIIIIRFKNLTPEFIWSLTFSKPLPVGINSSLSGKLLHSVAILLVRYPCLIVELSFEIIYLNLNDFEKKSLIFNLINVR